MNKIPWWSPETNGKEEKELVLKVLESNFPNDGEYTTNLENEIKKILGVKYCIAVTSGTTSLFLSLKALGIKPDDEVIVPDITFIATANAVSMCNANPVIVDVDPQNMCMDVSSFEKAITNKTKGVIVVHMSGRGGNLKEILRIAKKHGIFVIEDAAQAFASKLNNKYLGAYGSTGCFSFSPAKTITCGQGGAIVTNRYNVYNRLKELKDQGRPARGTGGADVHKSIGFNFKLTNLQSAVALGQLDKLKQRTTRMKQNQMLYHKLLKDIKEIQLIKFRNEEIPQWVDIFATNRDKLCQYLDENNIGFRKYYYPLHTQKPYRDSNINYPNSTKLSKNALWLPSAFTLTEQDIFKVCKKIKSFYKR